MQDRSGAVVLMAVFMAVFLTGLLWYTIGIGNAVIYRETMLDGADATAYSAAVYDARGMNVIAMINLIMAAIMAVLVVAKIIQVLTIAVNVITCVICAIPFGEWACPACAATTDAEPDVNDAVQNVQNVVTKVEPVLNKASTVVAVAMPWIAEVRSVMMAGSYGPMVHGGLTLSLAQLPGAGAKDLFGGGQGGSSAPPVHHIACCDGSESGTCTWEGGNSSGKTTQGGQPNRGGCCSHHQGICGEGSVAQNDTSSNESSDTGSGGGRIGLPVQDDDPNVLCDAAAVVVKDLIDATLGKLPFGIGSLFSFAGGLLDDLVTKFPGYFCGSGSAMDIKSGMQGALGDQLNKYGLDPTKACTPKSIKDHNNKCQTTTCPSSTPDCCPLYQGPNAVADCKKNIQKQMGGDPNQDNSKTDIANNEATKKIFDKAQMGDDDFAVFSVVWSDLGTGPDKGVQLAAWGKAQTPAPTFLTKLSYAKAEYYYDVGIGDFTFQKANDKPQQIPDDAMWNMRWRARLRRMHDPIPNVGADVADAINNRLGDLGQYLGGVSQAQQALGGIEQWTTNMGNQIDQDISQQVGSWLGVGTLAVVH